MKHTLLPALLIFTATLCHGGADPESPKEGETQFWYEDNNMRRAGGYPPDFEQMFTEPEHWSRLRSLVDVYYLRGNTLKNLRADFGEEFIRDHLIRVLNEAGIPIAIDNFNNWEKNIPMLQKFGAQVTAISMQSTLSKRVNHRTKNLEQVMDERIKLVVEDVKAVHSKHPQLRIGLIDALPTKGVRYKETYRKMVKELAAEGLELAYIHLDCPVDKALETEFIDWRGVKEVEEFVQDELGLEYGFICTSNGGGMDSDRLFYENVLKIPDLYPVEGRLPDHFIVMSWYPHPYEVLSHRRLALSWEHAWSRE